MALSALATIATVAALAPSAMAVTNPVTIKTAFENSPISLNTSDAVGYAFTNTSTAAQTVTFTDALPPGVTLDSPVDTTNTNGTGSCTLVSSNANPGATSVTVTVTIPSASGTVCTLSFSVVAATPSGDAKVADAYSGVSTASGALTTTTPGSLVVLSSPTLGFTAPSNGQAFYLGQLTDANFSCTATDPQDSIDSFFGTDDDGNQIQSGAPIDTVDPGAHSLEVDCYSAAGGGDVSQTVNYTVGSYTLKAITEAKKNDYVSFKTLVPAGRIVAEVIYGKKVIGTTSTSVTARGTASVTIKPTTAGKKLLAAVKGKSVAVKLQVSFNPQAIGTGDEEITPAGATVVTKNIKLPIAHAAKKTSK
ncbi:MAG TPA: hypothetical protein VG228_09390 [Solirubrobacteraceae bacterium]|nr:hypothetical protein [Solirubrobacteraceae bacterium]